MLEPLTDKQATILEFITDEMASKKRPPSVREIAARFRLSSVTSVRDHLAALERKGYIKRRVGEKRGLAFTPEYEETLGLPIIRHVATGSPVMAAENVDGYLRIGDLFPHDGPHFCLRVTGDDLRDEGILEGDYVIVHQKLDVENGEIGVVIIDGKCSTKCLRRVGHEVEVSSGKDREKPRRINPAEHDFRYGGEVIAVLRVLKPRRSGCQRRTRAGRSGLSCS